ncbi:hypothetical protein J6590_002670 [Homalodisca vitripennis]|nr:hypothetical protein J6590_002670 [Homalodisca vitripennis]
MGGPKETRAHGRLSPCRPLAKGCLASVTRWVIGPVIRGKAVYNAPFLSISIDPILVSQAQIYHLSATERAGCQLVSRTLITP